MSENKFWLGLWSVVGVVIIVIFTLTQSYFTKQNQLVADMVKAGVNPIAARCAVEGFSTSNSLICSQQK